MRKNTLEARFTQHYPPYQAISRGSEYPWGKRHIARVLYFSDVSFTLMRYSGQFGVIGERAFSDFVGRDVQAAKPPSPHSNLTASGVAAIIRRYQLYLGVDRLYACSEADRPIG